MVITKEWHAATIATLMVSACGDLILDNRGALCTRDVWDNETFKELPFAQHKVGQKLAVIDSFVNGWRLTAYGAQYILENCTPEKKSDIKKLESIAK